MYRLKARVLKANHDREEYKMLYRYAQEILRSNPGSSVKIKSKPMANKVVFERLYICWGALKRGMQHCRRVIFLDGCHIKTGYGGILLSALGLDANNSMYPFAYVVVEKERRESWTWFMNLVVRDLDITPDTSHKWTFMSDKQKGLINAVVTHMPNCEHRFCVYHIYSNFKLQHKRLSLKDALWRTARATRPLYFQRIMEELNEISPATPEWLSNKEPKHWSKAFLSTVNPTDVILNNLSESFNAILLKARKIPLIKMVETIRLIIMKRIAVKWTEMLRYNGTICPRIEQLLDINKAWAWKFTATWNGYNSFQVDGNKKDQWVVHIGDKTCSCRRWQLIGIPCVHALACLSDYTMPIVEAIDKCYTKETYMSIYGHFLEPLAGQDEWPEPINAPTHELQPRVINRMPGRPRKYRRRIKPHERERKQKVLLPNGKLSRYGMVMKCSKCDLIGHNKKTCEQLICDANMEESHTQSQKRPSQELQRTPSYVADDECEPVPTPVKKRAKSKGKEKVKAQDVNGPALRTRGKGIVISELTSQQMQPQASIQGK